MLRTRFQLPYGQFHLDADLEVPADGVTAIFGPSGSGKTTFLRCGAGLERAPGGYVRFGDTVWQDESRDLFVPPAQRAIGYVFQELRLFPHLTAWGNLAYGLKRTPVHERRVSFDQVVALLGLESLLDRRPHRMSGGEQQRVAIGRALLTSPRLLLMDEPLASLDQARKREILPFIQRLDRELRIPTVYVSHSLSEVLQLTKTLVILHGGKVMATGPINEVLSRLDLRGSIGQEMVGAVIDARVAEHELEFGLTRLEFNGRWLYVPHQARPVGTVLRVHILSKDVSLVAGAPPTQTSVLNILEATVESIGASSQTSASVDIRLDIGCPLLASITRKSLAHLALSPGQRVYAQITALALSEDGL